MDIESRLRKLEARYRAVLSATAEAIERANSRWKELEARKRSIVDRIDALEQAEST